MSTSVPAADGTPGASGPEVLPPGELFDLSGRVALVTGAGQGIGRGIARQLGAAGAAVVVNDVAVDRAQRVVAEIEAAGGTALAVRADVTDLDAVLRLVATVVETFGGIDVLVNNAGNVGADRGFEADPPPFWETGPEEWQAWFDVNLFGVMNCSRAVLPVMIERGGGRIVTLVSDAGRVGEPFLVPYSAAKAGAAGFVRSLAKAVGRHGITANTVSLGTVRSEERGGPDEETAAAMLRRYVIRRFGRPADVAAVVLLLASDASSWITGQTIPVNGGYSMAT